MQSETIYADANATYPVAPSHYDAVADQLRKVDGNPSSIHAQGREAKVALENARTAVARMFGADAQEIVFTSGATEGNNIVVRGLLEKLWFANLGKKADSTGIEVPHVIASAVEHPAVLEPIKYFAERGLCRFSLCPVDGDGVVCKEALRERLEPNTALVCLMHANNELGSLNPLQELSEMVKECAPKSHLHVDAVQTFGKMDLSWYRRFPIDSASVSGHKIGAFKGVGALFLRSGVDLAPLVIGGGQERARRPGTENLPGVISLGLRCRELRGNEHLWWERAREKMRAWVETLGTVPGVVIHGDVRNEEKFTGNTVNFHVEGVGGEDILLNFDLAGIQASSGSACASGVGRPSHVLKAIGLDDDAALNSVRTSFDASGDITDIQRMGQTLSEVVSRVRAS